MTVSINGTTGYAGPLGAITVDTSAIVANAVTPAKMSRTGTSGQVLTSNGAGADPSYQSLPAGGVTSAVAGNGIAVSGATGAVTISLAAPTQNTVGSYAFVGISSANTSAAPTFGTNYSVGSGANQVQLGVGQANACSSANYSTTAGVLSGTWKWLSAPGYSQAGVGFSYYGLAVRVA